MLKHTFAIAAFTALTLFGSAARADQWADAVQWEDTNVRVPSLLHTGYSTSPTTNLAIQAWGASCSASDPLQTFTAQDVPINNSPTPPYGSGLLYGPTSCGNGGQVFINISQFARQGDLLALQAQLAGFNPAATNAAIASLQAQLAGFTSAMDQLNQSLHAASVRSDQGIAMSMAMAGVAELQPDETMAVSANWGTFHGQNGIALGAAYRVNEHVSVNGGFVRAVTGGPVGGRAGIRFGW